MIACQKPFFLHIQVTLRSYLWMFYLPHFVHNVDCACYLYVYFAIYFSLTKLDKSVSKWKTSTLFLS